jgi:hypothetical protein
MDKIENIQQEPIENSEPTWQDVEEGKVNFHELPKQFKEKVKQEAYDQTPDDKKYLWKEGYTPPQAYKGLDRNGKPVEGLDLDGFEELLNKGIIKRKTKVEEDVEKLANVVKEQSKMIVSHQEKELNKKISELKEKGLYEGQDFEEYEKLLVEKNSIDFQKLELNRNEQIAQVKQEFTLDEQADVQLFQYQNKLFIETVQKDPQLVKFFDEQALILKQRNPNASLVDIMNAAKKITENAFNPKKQIPMYQNIERTETKTNLNQKAEPKVSYNSLNDRSKAWIDSAAKAGSFKGTSLVGKSLDEITTIIYKSINAKNEK